jgi:hypothetical protein
LIRAKTKTQALNYFVRTNITVKVASQDALIDAVRDGCDVEDYREDQIELDLPEKA